MTVALAMVSQKGGVGKTTLSLNLSLAFAQLGLRTLLVDVDPQGGIGLSLNSEKPCPGVQGFVGGQPLSASVMSTRLPGFSIMPTGQLRGLERARFSTQLEDGMRLSLLVDTAQADYDLVVFDTPAGLIGSTLGALRASQRAFTTLQAEPLAVNSLPQLLEVIGDLREEGAAVEFSGVILTMVQREVESSLNVVETIWNKLPHHLVLDAHIPRDPVFLRASELGVPLGLLSKRPPPIARRFDELAAEIADHLPELDERGSDDPIPLLV